MRAKRLTGALLALVMLLSLGACSKGADPEDWEEQYELGMRYLEEGDYENAILAFTAAIEIDPKNPEAYLGRGQAYQAQGTRSSLRHAAEDFEAALDLDEELEAAWIGLAEVRLAQGDSEAAAEAARQGLEALGDSPDLEDLLRQAENGGETPGGSGISKLPVTDETPELPEQTHQHTWLEANYQAPATCSECGEPQGDPLTPDFVTYGISTISCAENVGKSFSFTTRCSRDESKRTTAALTIQSYDVFPSDDTHAYREGYEWRTASFTLYFSDSNAQQYGMQTRTNLEDYYNIRLHDDSAQDISDTERTFLVSWYGEEMDVLERVDVYYGDWVNRTMTFYADVAFQVPEGYDGVVFGFHDNDAWDEDPDLYLFEIYDDTFVEFRLD